MYITLSFLRTSVAMNSQKLSIFFSSSSMNRLWWQGSFLGRDRNTQDRAQYLAEDKI